MRPRLAFQVPSLPSLLLYVGTLAAEVPVLFTRMFVTLTVALLALLLSGHSIAHVGTLLNVALIPTVWSIFALLTPAGGGWWWRQNLGGRRPSEREQLAYQDALDLLQRHTNRSLRKPASWFVIDTPQPDAGVCGDTLMLSRGLMESEYLPAVLAHELGHLAATDGKLTAALNRLVIRQPPGTSERQQPQQRQDVVLLARDSVILTLLGLRLVYWLIRTTIGFAKGGFGLRITAPAWGAYWREREYAADQYAALLGQADELADFLEIHALVHDHPVPFIWLTEHTHPPVELRIDRLRQAAYLPPAGVPSFNGGHAGQPQIPAP